MNQIRKRLTYANVMSSIAVFLILGGATAFAAKKIGANEIKANSIKTGKIVKEAVTAGKIKKGAVTETKIADGAVTTNKIANDAVTGAKVLESSLGEVPSAKNAKTLDGIGASAFSREASSSISNDALSGVSGTARQVNITAPQNGFLLAIGSADVFGSEQDFYECEFLLDNAKQSQTVRESEIGETDNAEENCDTNAIFPVTAGTHNVKFNFRDIESSTTVDETELDVVFIPFAG